MGDIYVDEDEAVEAVWRALSRAGYVPIRYMSDKLARQLPAVRIEKLAPSRVAGAEQVAQETLEGSGFAVAWWVECDYHCATDHTLCELCSRPRECGGTVYDTDEYEEV